MWLSYDEGAGVNFGNGAGGIVGAVSNTGNAVFNGTLEVKGRAVYSWKEGVVANGDFEQWNDSLIAPIGWQVFWAVSPCRVGPITQTILLQTTASHPVPFP